MPGPDAVAPAINKKLQSLYNTIHVHQGVVDDCLEGAFFDETKDVARKFRKALNQIAIKAEKLEDELQ